MTAYQLQVATTHSLQFQHQQNMHGGYSNKSLASTHPARPLAPFRADAHEPAVVEGVAPVGLGLGVGDHGHVHLEQISSTWIAILYEVKT